MIRAVVDTNVLFEGLTKQGSCGAVVDAWKERKFVPCVSTALALEYEATLTNKLGARKRRLAVGALSALLDRVEFIPVVYRVRPMSPDPDDDFVIECAFNANASIVTRNVKDFRIAQSALEIAVLKPREFLVRLEETPWHG
jgi:putative PIN family toxin of toxin-antitoxin system